jgi:hypothetical protein
MRDRAAGAACRFGNLDGARFRGAVPIRGTPALQLEIPASKLVSPAMMRAAIEVSPFATAAPDATGTAGLPDLRFS